MCGIPPCLQRAGSAKEHPLFFRGWHSAEASTTKSTDLNSQPLATSSKHRGTQLPCDGRPDEARSSWHGNKNHHRRMRRDAAHTANANPHVLTRLPSSTLCCLSAFIWLNLLECLEYVRKSDYGTEPDHAEVSPDSKPSAKIGEVSPKQ